MQIVNILYIMLCHYLLCICCSK